MLIISMAQQASPNIIGQYEKLRPKPSTRSICTGKAIPPGSLTGPPRVASSFW